MLLAYTDKGAVDPRAITHLTGYFFDRAVADGRAAMPAKTVAAMRVGFARVSGG